MINLLLVDDHPLVRDGIRARLESEPGIKVLGEAQNGQEALDFVAHQDVSTLASSSSAKVDVILMDVSMPVMNGLEATKVFKEQHPDVRILILSMHDSREYILQLIQSGASGYILKDVSSDELIKAIETVYQGGTYFSSGASQSLFAGEEQIPAPETAVALTPREATVLKHLAEGQSNKEIARVLDISVRTVETHRQNIKQKLNIHTAAGLARYAIENGLVD